MNALLVKGMYQSESDEMLVEQVAEMLANHGHVISIVETNLARPSEVRDLISTYLDADLIVLCSTTRKLQTHGTLKAQEVRKVMEGSALALVTLVREVTAQECSARLLVMMPSPPYPKHEIIPWVIAEGATRALVDCVPECDLLTPYEVNIDLELYAHLEELGWTSATAVPPTI